MLGEVKQPTNYQIVLLVGLLARSCLSVLLVGQQTSWSVVFFFHLESSLVALI